MASILGPYCFLKQEPITMASPRALRVSRTVHALFNSKHILLKISVNVKIVLDEEKKHVHFSEFCVLT